jgi:hypothetical protein
LLDHSGRELKSNVFMRGLNKLKVQSAGGRVRDAVLETSNAKIIHLYKSREI